MALALAVLTEIKNLKVKTTLGSSYNDLYNGCNKLFWLYASYTICCLKHHFQNSTQKCFKQEIHINNVFIMWSMWPTVSNKYLYNRNISWCNQHIQSERQRGTQLQVRPQAPCVMKSTKATWTGNTKEVVCHLFRCVCVREGLE